MTTSFPPPTGYRAPAVHRAFALLRALAEAGSAMSLTDLAARLEFSKSTTHGLVHALIREGALARTSRQKKLILGPAVLDMAFRNWNPFRVSRRARPVLSRLRDTTGETVVLGAMSGDRAIVMATAEAGKPLKITSPPGTSLPLLAGAVGKAFLSVLEAEKARAIVRTAGLKAYTARSIIDERSYLQAIQETRRCGYAMDNEEYMTGVRAVAAALGNRRGLPLAIWVMGFAAAMAPPALALIIEDTCTAARTLRQLLD